MTTIAWDGKVLATDSRMCAGNIVRSERTQKLWRIEGMLVAFSGDYQDTTQAVQWFKCGMPENSRPKLNDTFRALVVMPGRRIWTYEDKLVGFEVKAKIAATGSGVELALGAMAAGANAVQAVKIAARFDPGTNSRVQALSAP